MFVLKTILLIWTFFQQSCSAPYIFLDVFLMFAKWKKNNNCSICQILSILIKANKTSQPFQYLYQRQTWKAYENDSWDKCRRQQVALPLVLLIAFTVIFCAFASICDFAACNGLLITSVLRIFLSRCDLFCSSSKLSLETFIDGSSFSEKPRPRWHLKPFLWYESIDNWRSVTPENASKIVYN